MREKYEKQGFSQDQIDEIEIGLQKGLKVAHYAKKEFLAIQMHQIRLGLEEHLPVAKYASPEYDWFQMEEIREGLKSGLDVSKYANPEMSYEVMRQIRKGLSQGIELPYRKGMSAGILREIRRASLAKINITPYIREGYKEEQLHEIRKAIENGIKLEPYISVNFNGAGLQEIAKGLESKLDVKLYANENYSWQQMREIRLGLKDRVNTELYNNVLFNWKQMREIRLGLEEGLPAEQYATLMYTEKEMERKRKELSESFNEPTSSDEEFVEKLIEVNESTEKLDVSINISKDEMRAILVFNTNNKKMDKETLFLHLFKAGIIYGVDEEAVNIIMKGICKENQIVIARGTQPERGEDGYYEYFFRTDVTKKPVINEDGTVDYRNIDWMESVVKDQKIAYYHEAGEGIEGRNVFGKAIPTRKGKELRMLAGKGFELLQDRRTYVSSKNGKIELINDKIYISDLLELDDVTISTGNINFDGSVHVRGNVGRDASITATKDIIVDGFVEGAYLNAQGDIVLKKGCNGSGHGKITSGKDLMARFLEGAVIYSKGSVKINYCMNCDIYAENSIEVNGMIAGGTSYAGGSIIANDIGNHTGLRTTVQVGQNEKFFRMEVELSSKIRDVEEDLKMMQRTYDDFQKYPVEVRNTHPVYLKLEDSIYNKKVELEELLEQRREMEKRRESFEDAFIKIKKTIYEGTHVEISGVSWVVKTHSRVKLKKEEGRVAICNY